MAPSRTILIAGAGIGGMTAALALARKGFRTIILEKAGRLEEVGAGLQLSPNASRILTCLGVEPHLGSRVVAPDQVSVMSARSGREIGRIPLGETARSRYGAPYWIVHRADLQAALLERLREVSQIELRLGAELEGVVDGAEGVIATTLHNGDRQQDAALALIGADGVWSAVRRQLFPKAQAGFSGRIAWRGTIEADRLPRQYRLRSVQLWLGPNAHLVAYPVSGGKRINLVAVAPGSWNRPGWNETAEPADIRETFDLKQWPLGARMLVGGVDHWRRWALFGVDSNEPWVRGHVALVGDAAHAMLPFVAQGAGMAIEDAAVLARELGPTLDAPAGIPQALQRYETARRDRVERVVRTARRNGRIYHLTGPMALARDSVIHALSGQRLLARQDWIYDYRVD
ncbi:FAD-dependent monooxygenase [Bradyrhizobium sp. WD16]|uniref:FAD-dependent monooxygenase n=1 Tax=Bradyrhizobium sp. WD16 TaxID=1521768 RepID=UPI0020A537BB|nr:FAD-dependent monooxygenase [Bradyrhizobium sp. WD16]UTD28603.1 monooxygenase [Bradyrhizobium sp. WD16]